MRAWVSSWIARCGLSWLGVALGVAVLAGPLPACSVDPQTYSAPGDGGSPPDGTVVAHCGDPSDCADPACAGAPACQPRCGNGIVEAGEDCDDGNTDNTDACLDTCKAASCGDGFVQAGVEDCDDGNADNTDSCLDTCRAVSCGDGIVQAGEECDDGAQNRDTGACTSACRAARCGDGFVQAGEECDDGAQNSNSGACLSSCQQARCGDGFIQADVEDCDNGSENSDTGACTSACKAARCGDGFLQADEECDDGERNSNISACTSSCQRARCGDGFVEIGVEDCDDGDGEPRDSQACTSTCKRSFCGDGHTNPAAGEDCDDGGNNGDDRACLNSCRAASCGDGLVEAGVEQCDDGEGNSDHGACLSSCRAASCGDGFVEAGVEQCDTRGDTATCDSDCTVSSCGDGHVNAAAGEECDDGNRVNGDGCDNDCHPSCLEANLVPVMTSPTTPSGQVDRSGVFQGEEGWQAFDHSLGTLWLSDLGQTPAFLSYDWGSGPRTVLSYAIDFTNGDLTSRAPRTWTFEGWNGASWTVIDTRPDEHDWLNADHRVYTVDHPGSYLRYRIVVTEDNDDRADPAPIVVVSISELQLIGCVR